MADFSTTMKNKTEDMGKKAEDIGTAMKHKAEDIGKKGEDMGRKAHDTAEKGKGIISDVAEKASEAASTVGKGIGTVASAVGHGADDAACAVGSGMKSLGKSMHGDGGPRGVIGSAAATVGDALEAGGEYLEDHGLSGMAKDLVDVVRRNPLPALMLGVGIGFLLARAFTSRSYS